MHDTPPPLDVVAEWQHCQFARHAQDPRRIERQEAASARFWIPVSRCFAWICSRALKRDGDGNRSKGMKIKSRRLEGAGVGSKRLIFAAARRRREGPVISGCWRKPW